MSPAAWTFLGLVIPAIMAAATAWVVKRRSKDEQDSGVAAAADLMLGRMHTEYSWVTQQLEEVRKQVAHLEEARAADQRDRNTIARHLAETQAELARTKQENQELRARVTELEARATRNEGDIK